jgi:adenylate cyclase class 1
MDWSLEFQNALRAYQNYTLAKTRECLKDFSEGQKDAFFIIPYLLHTDEPKSLGYVDGIKAPCGIHQFKFNDKVKQIGKKYFSSKDRFDDPTVFENAPIESLSLMGSAGSIAQTEGSDLDYWVIVREDIPKDQMDLLQDKMIKIEKFCWDKMEAEVHFFPTTEKKVRDNQFGSVDKESCGTALGKLLKEEYYRSSLHVTGKIPLWWFTPYNANEEQYQDWKDKLSKSTTIRKKDYIDIGNVRHIPFDEFVGGGMWQLNKGVGSPFKSALKMGLLMEYADESQPRDLIAQMLKARMLKNPNDMDQLDPYLMMVQRVLQHLESQGDQINKEVLQRCLFLKMKPHISRWWNSSRQPPDRSTRVMLELCKEWGWDQKEVLKWEEFNILPMRELVDFKRKLESYMFSSLSTLRQQADAMDGQRAVSEQDFKKMTQRLTTIFNPERERTEWFYSPYDKMIRFPAYTIVEEKNEKHTSWSLYSGVVEEDGSLSGASEKKQLNSTSSLPDLVIWMLYNQLIYQDTKIIVQHTRDIPFTGNLKRLSESYKSHIGKTQLPTLDDDVFEKAPVTKKWLFALNLIPIMETSDEPSEEEASSKPTRDLIANELSEALMQAGFDEKAESLKSEMDKEETISETANLGDKVLPLRAGRVPPSEDPFNAGYDNCSVFSDAFVISKNSWGELHLKNIKGDHALPQCILSILKDMIEHDIKDTSAVYAEIGVGPYHQKPVKERFNHFLKSCTSHMLSNSMLKSIFFFELNGLTYLFERISDFVEVKTFTNLQDALLIQNMSVDKMLHMGFDEGHPKLELHQQAYKIKNQGPHLHLLETSSGFFASFKDESGRYFYDVWESKDLLEQLPPLLVCVLRNKGQSAIPTKTRLNITRCHTEKAPEKITDITLNILEKLKSLKHKIPKLNIKLHPADAYHWMMDPSSEPNESIVNEIDNAIELHHQKSPGKPFIISSLEYTEAPKNQCLKETAVLLSLRKMAIWRGRRIYKEKMNQELVPS